MTGKSLDQRGVDDAMIELDGTPTKSRLGANAHPRRLDGRGARLRGRREEAALRVPGGAESARGAASPRTLPVPMMNILNGGAHADSNVDVQEFMVMPATAPSFAEALRTGAEIFHALRGILKTRASRPASATKAASRPA